MDFKRWREVCTTFYGEKKEKFQTILIELLSSGNSCLRTEGVH